jgi:hypothetical protein
MSAAKKKEVEIDAILAALNGKDPRASFLLGAMAVWLHKQDVAMANLYLQELVRHLEKS